MCSWQFRRLDRLCDADLPSVETCGLAPLIAASVHMRVLLPRDQTRDDHRIACGLQRGIVCSNLSVIVDHLMLTCKRICKSATWLESATRAFPRPRILHTLTRGSIAGVAAK